MIDQTGRKINYMRISVTDRCNLRCRYCMPHGIRSVSMSEILTYEEIRTVVEEASVLGIRHIKLTGGEPLVRLGVADLIRGLKSIPGIETVTLTTNGVHLKKELPSLLAAGLDAVNISLDTMDRRQYHEITGSDELETVLEAIRTAADAAAPADQESKSGLRVKVNAVSLALGEGNLRALIGLAKDMPVDVRFIEMMPIGYGKDFPVLQAAELQTAADTGSGQEGTSLSLQHPGNPCGSRKLFGGRKDRKKDSCSGDIENREDNNPDGDDADNMYAVISHRDLLQQLQIIYPGMKEDRRQHGYGPAVYYTIPGFQGSVGLISAIHGKFCDSCNRVRLTSMGYLKTCLCYNEGTDLRAILRKDLPETEMRERLRARMRESIYRKPDAHCFDEPGKITERAGMNAIGG